MNEEPKTFVLRITAADKAIFDAIKNGKKTVETRAATARYANIKAGDEVVFSYAGQRLKKNVVAVQTFKTIQELLKEYSPSEIDPSIKTPEQLIAMFESFTGYKEKIAQFGIVAMELE